MMPRIDFLMEDRPVIFDKSTTLGKYVKLQIVLFLIGIIRFKHNAANSIKIVA